MKKITVSATILMAVFVVACVTINVYFPEAAAVEAADRIIDKVRGEGSSDQTSQRQPSANDGATFAASGLHGLSSFLIADAYAQAPVDFDKPSPKKQALESALAERFQGRSGRTSNRARSA